MFAIVLTLGLLFVAYVALSAYRNRHVYFGAKKGLEVITTYHVVRSSDSRVVAWFKTKLNRIRYKASIIIGSGLGAGSELAGATGTISVTAITSLITAGSVAITAIAAAFVAFKYIPKIYRALTSA